MPHERWDVAPIKMQVTATMGTVNVEDGAFR